MMLLCLMFLSACGAKSELPDDPIVFSAQDHGTYRSIINGAKEYVPYASVEPADAGECIGYFGESGMRIYVCQYRDASADAWVVTTPNLANRNEAMLFREVTVREIPEGVYSEYEWNK